MARQAAVSGVSNTRIEVATQHRCLCCGGIIENLRDEALSIGLDLKLGIVSDECALICDGCAAKLIEAWASRK